VATRALSDLRVALNALGAAQTPVLAVSSVPPPSGIEELVDALDDHRAHLDVAARRARSRRAHALADFAAEHGDHGVRALGGRREADRWLRSQETDPPADVAALIAALQRRAGVSS
jgi:LAO/AO transport system kinase